MSVESAKPNGIRRLFIDTMYGGFLAIVVFVIGTYMFVVPSLLHQQRRIDLLEAEVAALRASAEGSEAVADEIAEAEGPSEPAPAAAPEAVPAEAAQAVAR